jgi:uncharacterized YigZ family protein
VVKHSRFIAHAVPVAAPELALAVRDRISVPGATHNCWAYRIGALYRFSDDGEPGGSAGRPILQAIDAEQVDRVLVVVVRFYGGVKLGVGGLVRAYGGAARECLKLADKTQLKELIRMHISCSFSQRDRVLVALAQHQSRAIEERFEAAGVEIETETEVPAVAALERALADLSRGTIRVRRSGADG